MYGGGGREGERAGREEEKREGEREKEKDTKQYIHVKL